MKIFRLVFSTALLLSMCGLAEASQILPSTPSEQFDAADAVCRATVVGVHSYREADGMIYTRTTLRVDEGFKGRFPAFVTVVHHGGEVDGIGMTDDATPQFHSGEERLLFLSQRKDGTLFARDAHAGAIKLERDKSGGLTRDQGELLNTMRLKKSATPSSVGADVTDQDASSFGAPSGDSGGTTTNGLMADASGVPSRYLLPDRGEPIPYLVDATALPSGITLAQALNAVSNAMTAWANASSFRFKFAGTANFGTAAANINNSDGVFRIQLHDSYGYIPAGNILGIGGSWFTVGLLSGANWGPGGKVSGMEFNHSLNGYVVLKHTQTAMQNINTFTEVLTHEIGHVIGLGHSSDTTTADPVLSNSIMYYQAHADGRGAKLNSYDTNVVREVHPMTPPPYCYDRVMDITTTPTGAPNISGINQVELRGYSLGTTGLTLAVTNSSGPFSLTGSTLKYTPSGYFGTARLDPAGNSYYDIIYSRYSAGTNCSAYSQNRVISFNPDSVSPTDGIPDDWMNTYFGHSGPQVADKSRASDDADGDKLTNLQEYIAGMNPKSAASAQFASIYATNVIQWQAKAYELYEIRGTTNLASTNWVRISNPVVPTTSTGVFTNYLSATNPFRFFRVQKVP